MCALGLRLSVQLQALLIATLANVFDVELAGSVPPEAKFKFIHGISTAGQGAIRMLIVYSNRIQSIEDQWAKHACRTACLKRREEEAGDYQFLLTNLPYGLKTSISMIPPFSTWMMEVSVLPICRREADDLAISLHDAADPCAGSCQRDNGSFRMHDRCHKPQACGLGFRV